MEIWVVCKMGNDIYERPSLLRTIKTRHKTKRLSIPVVIHLLLI